MPGSLLTSPQELSTTIETLRKEKEYAEAADYAKSHFLATVSHELRTPLNAILGMAQILHTQTQLSQTEQRECIDTIHQSGNELLELINDILDFSRLDINQVQLESKSVDLKKIIARVIKLNGIKASKKNLHLVLDYNKNVHYFVQGDPHRMTQILNTLVDNAIKFTDHGEVAISITLTNNETPTLHINVSDTGIGIAPERLSTLFEKFVDTHLQSSAGIRLGLVIAKQLALLMDGELTVKSLLKKGSCFTLSLPLAHQAPEEETPIGLNLAQLNVLIIDDSSVRRNVIQKRLTSYQMTATSLSLEEALLHLRDHSPYDIILVSEQAFDHHIGRLARNLKALPALKNTLLAFAAASFQLDYEVEQALVAGYGCVLNTLEPMGFISHLARSWESWSQKNHFSIVGKLPLQKKRVLLVEDNILNQKVVKMMLADYGCTVDVAATGNTALQLLQKNHYALVLMDIGLPDISGLEVTIEFRRSEGDKQHTPIIALTAHALKGDEEIALASGMDGYLIKPLMQAQLQALLEEWLQK